MKRLDYIVVFLMMACIQTAWCQRVILHKTGGQNIVCKVSDLDSITFIDRILVEEIVLSETSLSLKPENTASLTATVLPADADEPAVKWESSNAAVAVVSSNGTVTAKGDGSCTITCTATDGSDVTTTCLVTVNSSEENRCPDKNHPHAIDLGLPSGTKWCCCNVGASAPEGYGSYYAWGETYEKGEYSQGSYLYYKSSGYQDIGSELAGTQYDVAYNKMGIVWLMPTFAQQQELISNCARQWSQINGVNGILLTGPNGGQIFLPAAGNYIDSSLADEGSYGNYWSSSLSSGSNGNASSLRVSSSDWNMTDYARYAGLSVRAVYYEIILTLSKTSVSVGVGGTFPVSITSGSGNYTATSSNTSIATASVSGNTVEITGRSVGGKATITVIDTQTDQTATIDVTVNDLCPDGNHPHVIDLGLPSGTKWCCCNVGADKPEGYGSYYAWGETYEKSDYSEDSYRYYEDGGYVNFGLDIAGTDYDVAHVKMGAPWCLPSSTQQSELVDYCTSKWTMWNGVYGRLVTGPNGNTLFLPAAGYRDGTSLADAGLYSSYGYYWSSSLNTNISNDFKRYSRAYDLYFSSSNFRTYDYFGRSSHYRYRGVSIRPVRVN